MIGVALGFWAVRVRSSAGVCFGGNRDCVCALGADREMRKIGRGLGCWGEGVAEMLRWELLILAKVSAVGWRARIWGRGAAAVSGREAAGVGLGCLGGDVGAA